MDVRVFDSVGYYLLEACLEPHQRLRATAGHIRDSRYGATLPVPAPVVQGISQATATRNGEDVERR